MTYTKILHKLNNIRTACAFINTLSDSMDKDQILKQTKVMCERMNSLAEELEYLVLQENKDEESDEDDY